MATWVDLAPASAPGARRFSFMDYDGTKLVLYSGLNGLVCDTETWVYSAGNWAQVVTANIMDCNSSPRPVFDGTRIIAVDHVGFPVSVTQTWEFTGTDWNMLSPSTPPPNGPYGMLICWTGEYVLAWGGRNGVALLDDTYIWDGTDWTTITTAHKPTQPFDGSIGSDRNGTVLMFGGTGTAGDDTWRWDRDALDWEQLSPSTVPDSRQFPAIGWSGSELVMFGGEGVSGQLDDTWIWLEDDWSECSPDASPVARNEPAISYYPGGLVIFGGQFGASASDVLDDTWQFNGTCFAPPPAPITAGISHRFGLG